MERTYSQKAARVFEILDYVLLIPTIISLIYPLLFMIGGITERSPKMVLMGFVPFIIVFPGLILLFGYRKHAKDKLDEKYIPTLWLTTAVYNFLLLLPWLFIAAKGFQSPRGFSDGENLKGFLITVSAVFGYIAAIVCSLKAYLLEKRKNVLR